MSDLKFFKDISEETPMHFSLEYCKTCDWMLQIWRKGMANDPMYKDEGIKKVGNDVIVFYDSSCDLSYLMSKAEVAVKDFLFRYHGGY